MEYDFTGLTLAQQRLLTLQFFALGPDKRIGPRKQTFEPLVARGLLVEHKEIHRGNRVYTVPIPVHMAWCDHCSRQLSLNVE